MSSFARLPSRKRSVALEDLNSPIRYTSRRHRTLSQKWALVSLPNKLTVISTIVIAIATVVNFGVAVAMWSEMRKATVATGMAANAANQSVKDIEAVQSAQLVIEDFKVDNIPQKIPEDVDPYEAHGTYTIRNVGQTVALDIGMSGGGGGGEFASTEFKGGVEVPSDDWIQQDIKPTPPDQTFGFNLAPGQIRTFSFNIPMTQKVIDGKEYRFKWIGYGYRDIFHHDKWTSDCITYASHVGGFAPCKSGHNH
jgi:hypothetical protein